MQQGLPYVSAVVIGRNEGERLVRCLRSVQEADYPPDRLELIYVDSDSTDGSCAVAEKLGAKVIAIHPERLCAAAARNAGLHAASYELIQFLDGDTILNRLWLRKAVAALDDPRVAGVFGRMEEIAPTATIYNFWAHHDWYIPPGPKDYCGGIVLFRRAALLKVGGYDSSLIAGEERDLCFRLTHDHGLSLVCLDEPMVLHDIGMSRFGHYWRRCFRAGYGYAQVSSRYRELRAWRRVCRRNMLHACAVVTAVTLSVAYWSLWPAAIWTGLVALAIGRDALRCRWRVGSVGGAMLYAVHHYLSKIPTVAGHVDYYMRALAGRFPKELGHHRGQADRRRC